MTSQKKGAAAARRLVAFWLKLPRAVRLLALLGWAGFLWYESAQPPKPHTTFNLVRSWLHNAAHVPAFGLLGLLAGFVAPSRLRVAVGIASAFVYGIVDEYHQSFTPGRTASWTDVQTDTVAAALALACYLWITRGTRRAKLWSLALIPCGFLAPTIATFW